MIKHDEISLGEPAYKVGSLFKWNEKTTGCEASSIFMLGEVYPVGLQQTESSPVIWDWQYRVFYIQCPIRSTFKGETEIKSLLNATELILISEGETYKAAVE